MVTTYKNKSMRSKTLALSSIFVQEARNERLGEIKRTKKMKYKRDVKLLNRMLESQGLFDLGITTPITTALEPTLDRFSDIMSETEQKLRHSMRDVLSEFSGKLCLMALAVVGCYALYNISSKIGNMLVRGFKIAISALGKQGSALLLRRIKTMECQSAPIDSDFLSDTMSLVLGFLLLDSFSVKDFLKVVTNDRKREGFSKGVGTITNILTYAFDTLKGYLTGSPVVYGYSISDSEVSDWMHHVKDLSTKKLNKKLVMNAATFENVLSLSVIGHKLKYKYAAAPRQLDNVKNVIKLVNLDIDSILKEFSKSSFDKSSIRSKPLTVLLKGKSGVGKSAMTIPLLDNLLMRTFKSRSELDRYVENNMDFIYSRAPETDFWDGYFGQKAIVIDDFLQADDLRCSGSIINEAFELIRMSNTYPMLLHKAHLDDKGNSYMTSKVIMCSTNNLSLETNVIKEKEALKRRFDIVATVFPKLEFCKDPNVPLHQRRLKKLDGFNVDVYEIHMDNGSILSYKQLCDLCVETYNNMQDEGTDYLNSVGNIRKEVYHDAIEKFEAQMFETPYDEFAKRTGSRPSVSLFRKQFKKVDELLKALSMSDRQIKRDKLLCKAIFMSQIEDDLSPTSVHTIYTYLNEWAVSKIGHIIFDLPDYEDVDYYEGCTRVNMKEAQAFTNEDWLKSLDEISNDVQTNEITNKYDMFSQKLSDTLESCKSFVANKLKEYPILPIVGMVTMAIGIYSTITSELPLEPEAYSSIKNVIKVKPKDLSKVVVNMSQQATEVDVRNNNNFMSLARRNMYTLNAGGGYLCHVVFIRGSSFLINKHCYSTIVRRISVDPSTQLNISLVPVSSFIAGSTIGTISFSNEDFTNFSILDSKQQSDIVLVNATGRTREHKDITHLFATKEEMDRLGNNPKITVFVPNQDKKEVSAYTTYGAAKIVSYSDVKNVRGYTYMVDTKKGDCGSLSLISDPHVAYGKILAFHGAGGNGMGCGLEIPQDLVTPIMVKQSNDETLFGHKVIAKLDAPVFVARSTKLRPSLVSGWCGPPLKAPAQLRARDGVDPYDLCLQRYATPDVRVDPKQLLVASAEYSESLNKLPNGTKRLLTFEEAVEGIHGDPYINGIPRGTSAGYPYCTYLKNGKKQIFGAEGPYRFDTEECVKLRHEVEHLRNTLKKGIRPTFYYVDSLKDELRSIKKVKEMKTRMISCCPVSLTILTKMYFGTFCSFMMHNKIYSGSAVGINPFSKDWSDLANFMGGSTSKCVAGDFTSFDATQSSDISNAIVTIINDWYGDEHSDIRELLWREVVNSKHVHNDVVVEFSHCLPSGHPMTSIANSMFVNLAVRLCWIKHNNGMLSSIDHFGDSVNLVAYGDDNIMNMKQSAVECGFDFTSIKENMAELGLIYTPEDKESGDYAYKNLSNCTFLKRSFDYRDNIWYAPLDLTTILEMPMWYRKGPDTLQRQVDNIDNCLRELSIHGPSVYDTYGSILLNEAFKFKDELKMSFIHKPIEYYVEKCFSTWVDEESLDDIVVSNQSLSNVPHSGIECAFSAQADILGKVGFDSEANKRPAENINKNKQADQTVSDPVYNSLGSTTFDNREQHETTGFVNDAADREYIPFPINNMVTKSVLGEMVNKDNYDVTKILKIPLRLTSFTMNSTDAKNTTIHSLNLPFDNDYKSELKMYLMRLNAYQGFRATAVVKYQVNVHRFAQGRLLCQYIPGDTTSAPEDASHRFNLMTKSQCPNIQINVNRDTSVEMRVPYVSAWPAYDLTKVSTFGDLQDAPGQMGRIYANVYSPLVGTTSVDIEVWLHFEDIELINATKNNMDAQSLEPQSRSYPFQDEIPSVCEELLLQPQANIEDSETPSGIFSSPLNKVSKALGVVAEIPSLTSLAGTAAWYTRIMSRAAAALGFSKPDSESRLVRVVNQGQAYAATGDGHYTSYKFGLSASNKLDVLPGFAGNDIDEMSIEYLCNRNAYVNDFTWNSTDAVGTILYNSQVGASIYEQTGVIDGTSWYTMTPFTALSKFFSHWRADITYTFKFVKTEFHTGRVSLSFRPGFQTSVPASDECYLYREILDLKESDTFVVTIPYCSLTPFVQTDDVLGHINMRVVNPLKAPSSVSSGISVIVEVSASKVQFNGITDTTIAPISGTSSSWAPQSADIPETREKVIVMTGMSQTKNQYEATRFVCGEAITSVKQLLLRMTKGRFVPSFNSNLRMTFCPFTLGGVYNNSTNLETALFSGDMVSTISSWYTLARGGVKIWFNSKITDSSLSVSYPATPMTVPYTIGSAFASSPNSTMWTVRNVTGCSDVVTVSQWGLTHARQCDSTLNNSARAVNLGEPDTVVILNAGTNWTANNFTLARSVCDDYQLGFFIGVPVSYIVTGTVNAF